METLLLILFYVAVILVSTITLRKHNAFLKDSDTWGHVTPVKPGHITDTGTGESRPLTEEEIDDFCKSK